MIGVRSGITPSNPIVKVPPISWMIADSLSNVPSNPSTPSDVAL